MARQKQNIEYMKLISKISLLALVLSLAGSAAFADQADCCKKAVDAGKTCKHKCCVAAAREGKECEKCGGKGDIKKADKTTDKK